jgi:hypothetical protein
LTAQARTFPGRRSRLEDSTAAPRLRRSDLVWAPDPACSSRRIVAFDPAAGRYLPGRCPPVRIISTSDQAPAASARRAGRLS